MTTELALLVSLVSIASTIWWYRRAKTKRHVCKKIRDKINALRSLEESVKGQSDHLHKD